MIASAPLKQKTDAITQQTWELYKILGFYGSLKIIQ